MSELSTFAGLQELDPGDPLSTNGYAFTSRNVVTTDQWLSQIPAHRHNAFTPLANPLVAPNIVANASGGQLSTDTEVWATYTLLDNYGGETAPAPYVTITTQAGIGAPSNLASATAYYGSGQLLANTFQYVFTLTDGSGGESSPTAPLSVQIQTGNPSAQVNFTGLSAMMAASPGATGWRCYKAVGGAQYELLTYGTANTFVDNGTLAVIYGTQPPVTDTTNQTSSLTLVVPSSQTSAAVGGFNVYVSMSPSFFDPSLFGTYPQSSGGQAISITGMALLNGSPPPISTAARGAQQISPTTDIAGPSFSSASITTPYASGGTLSIIRPAWAKLATQEIGLEGCLTKAAAWAYNDQVLALPSGARPAGNQYFTGVAQDDTNANFIIVLVVAASGAVTIYKTVPGALTPGTNIKFSLDQIRFPQAN